MRTKQNVHGFYRSRKRELVTLCILLGLIPGIADFSLFSLSIPESDTPLAINPVAQWVGISALVSLPIMWLFAILTRDVLGLLGSFSIVGFGYYLLSRELLPEEFELPCNSENLLLWISQKISFLIFILRGNTRSLPFFAVSIATAFVFGPIQALILTTLSILGRFIVLAFSHNIGMIVQLGWKKAFQLPVRAFVYWSPMLLIVIPSVIFSKVLHQNAVQAIYDNTFITQAGEEKDFENDLKYSLDLEFGKSKAKVKESMDDIRKTSNDKADQVPDDVKSGFLGATPDPLLKKKECGFFDLGGHIGNAIKGELNNVYETQRQEAAKGLHGKATSIMTSVNNDVQAGAGGIHKTSDDTLDQFNSATYYIMVRIYWVTNFVVLLIDVAFLFMVIKSYLYVFARVTFSSIHGIPVTLKSERKRMPKGNLRKCGTQYTILSSNTKDFYVSRTLEPLGRPPKFSIPQWCSAAFARIKAKAWSMNHVVMRDRKGSVSFRSLGGAEFVEWDLKPGEVVIFDFKSFVAMSETIQITRIASLRVSSLLFGRIFFTAASGPGKLVLMTKGSPILDKERKAGASVPPSRLVAWQQDSRFHVESELNVVDVFMSGIHLKKMGNDLVIIDADERGKAKSGIVKFLIRFIFPF